MLHLPHFAFSNLYLRNGYVREVDEDCTTVTFVAEAALEAAIRNVLVLRPGRLNGRHLRFIRKGLGLTQAELGKALDRDEQTIARLEKDPSLVPKMVDLCVRAIYLAAFAPSSRVDELTTLVVDKTADANVRVVLTYIGGAWIHQFERVDEVFQIQAVGIHQFVPLLMNVVYRNQGSAINLSLACGLQPSSNFDESFTASTFSGSQPVLFDKFDRLGFVYGGILDFVGPAPADEAVEQSATYTRPSQCH